MQKSPGCFDADPRLHNEALQFPHPPVSSFSSSVIAGRPAKRITFYKSGDAQFKGVKMAIHKRSFKCFDALLDDLSQKVPLPFGVRTITTPRGTHSIKHLEQLEDGGCYLCSDRRCVKPINMEAAGKRPAVWHHHSHTHTPRRRPSRPEEPHTTHTHHRQPKRIILVKNSDPAVRRSVVLSRRTARSLRVFMDEISELMQCHVRKLYTLEGRKIDTVQSLMQCPSVLVCVGREPFRPPLMESLKKLSDEKLPGMGTRSHSSNGSDGHESKKNVNFGLETKKSIIHPRSDSSNRSTRFSLSSEKSYQNGLCMTPGQSGCVSSCPYVKEMVVNDDIEKRVLVNKDGSLSVEMKVRFRLFNDETLQWSTEIKKSSTKVSESGSVKDAEYLQAKAEYSDPDSVSASETDEAFATKLHQKHLEEAFCQNCCNHCQEYDIWKNPMHKDQGASKSPSSSGSSHKVVRKKSSMDSTRTISRSSGECVEHVVEKSSCFQETMEEGDTRVQFCAIRRCCSRSEVSSAGNTSKSKKSCQDVENKCCHAQITEPEMSPMPQFELIKVGDERPISAVSNSSKVLESLKEDQDDDYDDLPPSVSRASEWSQSDHLESDDQARCSHCCGQQASRQSFLSPRPPSKESSSAVQSLKLKKYKTNFTAPIEPDGMSTASAVSKLSSNCPPNCHCEAVTPSSVASGEEVFKGRNSQKSCKSRGQTNTPGSKASEICNDAPANSATSLSRRSGVCSCCGECKNPEENEPEKADSILSRSNKSTASTSNAHENHEPVNNASEGEATWERPESGVSKKSHASKASKMSKKSNFSAHEKCSVGKSEHNEVERTKSAMSAKSDCINSEREPTPALILTETDVAEEKSQERAVSPMSARSNLSAASKTSRKSMSARSHKAKTPRSCSPNDLEEVPSKLLNSQGDKSESAAGQNQTASDHHCEQDTELPQEVRSASAMSNKSKQSSAHPSVASEETKRSVRSCELQNKDVLTSSEVQCEPETELTAEERLCSPLSNFSKRSVKSNVSSKHSRIESISGERVPSALSVKTNASKRSCRSHKSNHNVPETTVTSVLNDATLDECAKSNRTTSAMSQTSEKSNACSERSVKSGEVENGKNATQNALTVTSPLPRRKRSPSPRSTHHNKNKKTDSRAPSGMSENSNASAQSQRSSKCKCHSASSGHLRETKPEILKEDPKDESVERLSAKSPINNVKSLGNQCDEPLSPTSTASVSLGLGEEHRDLEERSTSGMSVNTEHKAVNGEERPKTEASMSSAISGRSKKSIHKNCKTPAQALSPVPPESVTSAELKKSKSGSQLNENNIRVPSTLSLSSSRSKSPSRVSKGSAKNTAKEERDCEAVSNGDHAELTEASSKHDECERAMPASDCLNSSKASAKSKNARSTRESDKRSKCSSQCLEINELIVKQNGDNDGDTSLKTSTERRSVKNDASRPNSAVMSDVSESLRQEISKKKKTSVKCPNSSSDSVLSRALSAADLLREIVGNSRPGSRGSKSGASSKNVNKVENKSQKSSRSKHSQVSGTSEPNKELMPSCLPNASPTDVVNDWLRNIPVDGFVYEMDGEITEDMTLAQDGEEAEKCEAENSIIEVEEPLEDQEAEINVHQETNCVEMEDCNEGSQLEKREMEVLTKQDSLQKQCQVQVMKVLLGPKLDRSSSLPEVSPVYGRKLSQSAQGLLDCLASLRLIDSDSKNEKQQKYNEVMMILQSLWLQKPSEDERIKQNAKENQSAEDEYNPHSSSGVDVNSGSGSGKGSVNGVVEKIETTQGIIPPITEREASVQDNDEVKSTTPACEGLDPGKDVSDPVTPDIAERAQGSPVNPPPEENSGIQKEDTESSENKNESDQTPQTTSYKSSGNESYTVKSPENTSSGTPPSVQRAPLIKRMSQDPDPVWVLALLKKLEKQFMLHYADAMAEFKVRWDLDDNEMLDTMIKELKEEVHKRIQLSISRELQKIQSRAGRGPRPPGNMLSRESTGQTEQRRKRLRVMRNKSITMSGSDDNYTASGTDNSDQRSDDEYCPCDACIKKKMASRAAQKAQALTSAPVMMEFDLRKILQMKADPVKPQVLKPEEHCTTNLTSPAGKEECNLDVLHEEVEDVNEIETADQEEPDAEDEEKNRENNEDTSVEKGYPNEEGINNEGESGDVEDSEGGDDVKDEEEVNNKEDAEEGEAESLEEGIKKEDEVCEEVNNKEDAEEEEAESLEEGIKKEDEVCEEKVDTANEESCETPEEEKEDEMAETGELGDNGAQTVTEDQSAESKSNNDDTPETTEGEKSDDVLKVESESERNANGDETSDMGLDEENGPSSKVKIEVEVRGDTEDETNAVNEQDESVVNDCESTLAKQVTRTSVESQPGSMENGTNQTALTKLKELQSFMESMESQGEMVVIMKQPPYKETGNHTEMCNGLSQWQVSPKMGNRANKQKK